MYDKSRQQYTANLNWSNVTNDPITARYYQYVYLMIELEIYRKMMSKERLYWDGNHNFVRIKYFVNSFAEFVGGVDNIWFLLNSKLTMFSVCMLRGPFEFMKRGFCTISSL
nr:hypothetical protein HDNAPKKO_00048 [Cydia pomonella granulovirus]WOZ45615.1 hypothetical protein AAGMHLIN_00044 [Cydia pomonella granulovirus]WOZ46433.1 hypothetical protein JEKDHOOB_00047 [Cydia pomonella granulovirus]WOZ46570.1 hypothetical protein ENACNPPH_00047 [Cydia pomonella granulovirus]WOZ46843.1 hypothetical protein ICELHAMJ_00046 [Cydia pomonella granulovirus]